MFIETFDTEKISKARDRWSGLSESDLRGVGNDSERLVDVVSRKNGIDRAQASREVDEFLESCGCNRRDGNPSGSPGSSKADSNASGSRSHGGSSEPGQRSATSQPGNRPGTSTDDQTGEMAAAQPGRKTRPEPKNL